MKRLFIFAKNESGAVAVDWVVLTAAVIALAGGAIFSVREGALSLADNIGASVEQGPVKLNEF